jgi:hypothetical protein
LIPSIRDLPPELAHSSTASHPASPGNHPHIHHHLQIGTQANLIPNLLVLLRSMRTIRVKVVSADSLQEWAKHTKLVNNMKSFLSLQSAVGQD